MRRTLGLMMYLFMDLDGAGQDAVQDEKKKKEQNKPAQAKEEVVVIEAESPLNPPDVFDSKQSTDVLNRRLIQERLQARTLPEALEETPGVGVQKTGPGQGSPFIRLAVRTRARPSTLRPRHRNCAIRRAECDLASRLQFDHRDVRRRAHPHRRPPETRATTDVQPRVVHLRQPRDAGLLQRHDEVERHHLPAVCMAGQLQVDAT